MSGRYVFPTSGEDPKTILGVPDHANDEEIRRAYLEKIKEYPPDRMPAEFERIRDAYEALKDPHNRAMAILTSVDPEVRFQTLLENQVKKRRFVGPEPWIEAMKEKTA